MNLYTRDAQQAALGFLVTQTTYIEPQVYAIQYPDIQYPNLIPVDTSAPEWVKSVTYFSTDRVGRAQWFHHTAKDVPLADISREKFEIGVEMAAIGYRYTLEELGHAMMVPGTNLTVDKAAACRRAYEEFVDNIALNGDNDKNWQGLINNSAVTSVLVANSGTGSNMDWDTKTADQILLDVNAVLTGIYTTTLTVEMADTLLLPIEALALLATRRIPDTAITIMEFLQKNNVYTAVTGQALTIRGVRGLESAGVANTARMIAYRRDPQVIKLHIPMPHRFLPVWQTGPMTFDIPGIFRLAGLEIRRPGAVRYADGILDAPYE